MILTLIAILALAGIGVFLVLAGNSKIEKFWRGLVVSIVGVFALAAAALLLLFYASLVNDWIGAGYKADIVNREYGTTYSQAEMFYAGGVIDVVRELDRKRYELTVNKGEPSP